MSEIEHERRRNHARAMAVEREIYRSATRGLHSSDYVNPRLEPTDAKEAEREKQAAIEAIAAQIESTGTASENPEE